MSHLATHRADSSSGRGSSSAANGTHAGPTVGGLVSAVTGDLSLLLRQEIALAKAEASQSASCAGKGAGLLAGAGVSGHFVLLSPPSPPGGA